MTGSDQRFFMQAAKAQAFFARSDALLAVAERLNEAQGYCRFSET